MAELELVGYDATASELEAPQGADTYVAKKAITFEQAVTLLSTIAGRTLAADGAKLDLITVTLAVDLDALNTRVNNLGAAVVLMGTWSPLSGSFPVSTKAGECWIISADGMLDGVDFKIGDRITALIDGASTLTFIGNWFHDDYTDKVSSVAGKVGAVALTESDISDLQSYLLSSDINTIAKLNTIIADATLADSSTFASAAQGLLAATALQPENIDTLAELNAIISDATLIDTADSRLSDARTPVAHTHSQAEISTAEALADGITAYAGGGQTSAVLLTAGAYNLVQTVASAGDSVKLPSAAEGIHVRVANKGNNYMDVFPNNSDNIGLLAIDLAVRLYPGMVTEFIALDNAKWEIQ